MTKKVLLMLDLLFAYHVSNLMRNFYTIFFSQNHRSDNSFQVTGLFVCPR